MPKKKKGGGKSKLEKAKGNEPKKVKIDKSFGLKNKKGKKQQNQIRQMKMAEQNRGKSRAQLKKEDELKKRKLQKKQEKEMAEEWKKLNKTVSRKTHVPKGVDPKSVLCEAFKKGACVKGRRCPYSHDVEKSRKVSKINLYADPRKLDTMDKWDQEKLEKVVASKYKKKDNETKIVCKYFLTAIEQSKYGWFWKCPSGRKCIYQHKLPTGYVLKKDVVVKKVNTDKLEEDIEKKRKKMDHSKGTPVTPETFAKWKERQKKKKKQKIEQKKAKAKKKGGGRAMMSGRALFTFNPELFVDDEDAVSENDLEPEEDAEAEKKNEEVAKIATQINEDLFLDDEDLPDSDED